MTHITLLKQIQEEKITLSKEQILLFLSNKESTFNDALLLAARHLRTKYFSNKVQIHIINNVRNGICPEDCGYCAQRRDKPSESVPMYSYKTQEEILEEARVASEQGAFRYCLVSAGRGPNKKQIDFFSDTLKAIKQKYPHLETCLSAGLITDKEDAETLKKAGLDRYNHNLNTSARHYANICSTHTYEDRLETLKIMKGAEIELCSGLIAGLGETDEDIADTLLELRKQKVPSIPVNFFIPIPDNNIVSNLRQFSTEKKLRLLAITRLLNPRSEIRLAAGRELYFQSEIELQKALYSANSIFVSGYLNVQGASTQETYALLEKWGYSIEKNNKIQPKMKEKTNELNKSTSTHTFDAAPQLKKDASIQMKDLSQLRPFYQEKK